MFRRLLIDDWQRTLSAASLLAFGIVLLLTFARAWWLSKAQAQRLSSLPLGEEEESR